MARLTRVASHIGRSVSATKGSVEALATASAHLGTDDFPSVVSERIVKFTKRALDLPFGNAPRTAVEFDQEKLSQLLNADHHELRKDVLEFLGTDPVMRKKHAMGTPLEDQRELTQQQLTRFCKSGLIRFRDVKENPLRYVAAMESLYYHGANLSTKAGVHFGLFGGTIVGLGTTPHHEEFMDKIASLEVRGCFCLTELGHGSNARGIETTAEYNHATKEYILNTPSESAQKIWIGNLACHGNHGVIFAQLFADGEDRGVHAFVMRIRDENGELVKGVRVKDCGVKMGLNGIDNGRLWLDHVRIPKSSLLNKFADVTEDGRYESPIKSNTQRFTAMISALVGGRIVVAGGSLNFSKVGLAIAVRYGNRRRQFGPNGKEEIPIMDFLSHQRRLLPLIAKTIAAQLCINYAKSLFAQGEVDMAELHILAAGMKPYCTWHKVRALQECREACGGMGFLAANRIGVLKTDSDIDVTWEGDNNVLVQQVSGSLLKEFKAQFKSGSFVGLLSYFGRQMSLEIRDKHFLKRRWTSGQHLRDTDFYRDAMEYREARLLRSLVNKLKRSGKKDPFMAWNESLDLVKDLAMAHVERQVVDSFVKTIDTCDKELRPILRQLCALHSLSCIQEHMDWYLTFNYFTSAKSKAIWEEINKLCSVLRPHAEKLVDSFGIPLSLLDAPIAEDYVRSFVYPKVP